MSGRHGPKQKRKQRTSKEISDAPNDIQAQESADPKPEDEKLSKTLHPIYKPTESMVQVWGLIVAVVVAVIYFLQLRSMQETADIARKGMEVDQRAWIQIGVRSTNWHYAQGQIGANVDVQNIGKTIAKKLNGTIAMVVLPVDNSPNLMLSDKIPTTHFEAGAIFPNEPQPIYAQLLAFVPGIHDAQSVSLSGPDAKDFENGKTYVVLYGQIDYMDAFDNPHWTRFCQFYTPYAHSVTARNCTEYNDVDEDKR